MDIPHEITQGEWAKIIKVQAVVEAWDLEPDETPEFAAGMIYGVRFDYKTDGPGHATPLYLLKGAGDPAETPVALIDRDGELVVL